MVEIVHGPTKKPSSADRLKQFFTQHAQYEGVLYVGHPIIGTVDGPYPIDALLVSRSKGVVLFTLVEGRETAGVQEMHDDSFNKLGAKLRANKSLMRGRSLQVPVHPVIFAPMRQDAASLSTEEYTFCNEETLSAWLDGCAWEDNSCFDALLAVIQTISSIRKGRKRVVQRSDSRGAKLKQLEDSIANLDSRQNRAVIETVEGVQRIRGLAGSGKTIVLALKAAYLHVQHPDWKIAVTFQSRALKGQFRRLIGLFTMEQSGEEPNWDNLHVLHAWGAAGGGERAGVYYGFCQAHGLTWHDYGSAKEMFGQDRAFEGACQKALDECAQPLGLYDAMLVDEAQDFPAAFLRLCYEMLKPEKRLVYAYDELQNLDARSLPSPGELFGKTPHGSPRVFLANQAGQPCQDVILEKCYRNSRPVLVTAHALGFGVYRTPGPGSSSGLVQMFDNKTLWREVGYFVADGALDDGCDVTLERRAESSPRFLEEHSPLEDLLQFYCFSSAEEQAAWVTKAIQENLQTDELRPDDIVVINPNPLTTRSAVGPIRTMLLEAGIDSHLAGVDSSRDSLFDPNGESVAFTGIHRAKGNEAGMVYILNAQECYGSFGNVTTLRNRLFTAITRSKAWVRVLGFGTGMQRLQQEFQQVKEHAFTLRFRYPNEEERRFLRIVNRDRTEDERRRAHENSDAVARLLGEMEAGRLLPEDLGVEQVNRLKKILDRVPLDAHS
ncbi:MAG: ATP-binding domain-containing protein [Magnetococcales bacterium]|nr:ATP-binding domain-containing protein [Magnetococcales bacterium]